MRTQSQTTWVQVERKPPIAIVWLNRPNALNALSDDLIESLAAALETLDADTTVRCMILAGRGRAFAAGADIKAMAEATQEQMEKSDRLAKWMRIWSLKKPLIAAVHGFILGGGCEIAMGCDMIIASEDAEFGQPEILIGVMPGAGGTQRLTQTIGKHKAMELILTGRRFSAAQAYEWGLVNRVVPREILMSEAQALAIEIAQQPAVAVMRAKEAVRRAGDVSGENLAYERKLFYSLFSTEDQKEGMRAFLEKRKPNFKGK